MAKTIAFGGTFNKSKSDTAKPKKVRSVKYPSGAPNLERDAMIELTELQKEFKDKAKKEKELFDSNTDTEFFSVVVFNNRQQRDSFVRLLGLNENDNQYLDGQKLMKALEMKVDIIKLKNPGKFKCNAGIVTLAQEI